MVAMVGTVPQAELREVVAKGIPGPQAVVVAAVVQVSSRHLLERT